jgi:dTDP-glucose 4,6-dehydratase
MKGNIAVIGSHSFSGNAYIGHLLQKHGCLSISRSKSLLTQFDSRTAATYRNNEKTLIWNVNDNSDHIIRELQDQKIDTILNFAAQSMVGQSWLYPEDWYESNIVGLAKFINRLRTETEIKKFIQFSTPEVYGSTEGWIKESDDFKPSTPYAVSRAAGDWHLKVLCENFGFPVIFTRAANVYGENQPLYRIVPKLILFALTGRKIPLQGEGKSIRSFIHISDVNSALDQIIMKGVIGETYHISTNNLVSIQELVRLVADKLNIKFDDLVEMAPDRPGKDFAYQLNSDRLRRLGWADGVNLDEGLDRTISWVTNNLSELRHMSTEYVHRK